MGEREPDRMTDAREKVLAVLEDFGEAAFTLGELAEMAGVSTRGGEGARGAGGGAGGGVAPRRALSAALAGAGGGGPDGGTGGGGGGADGGGGVGRPTGRRF